MAAPVKNTCPDIDRLQKILKSAISDANYCMKKYDRGSDEYEGFKEVLSQIEDIPYALEELRNSNDELRKWGTELGNELETAAYRIEELETELHANS